MTGTSQVKVYLSEELHDLLNADGRTNSEVVEAALWREFGGERKGPLERRIEEQRRRISMIESEKNERERELDEHRETLRALEVKYDEMATAEERRDRQREDALDERLQIMADQNMKLVKAHPSVENIAADFYDGDTDAAYRALIERNDELNVVSDDNFLDA